MKRVLMTVGLLILIGLGFWTTGCGRQSPSGASDPIKIGILAPFDTQPGDGIRNGVQMAVEEINAAGGVNGRSLEVVAVNTEYSAEKGVRGYTRLAGKNGVVAVLGVADDSIFPIMEQLRRYKVPMITTGTGSDKLTELVAEHRDDYKWFFRVMHKSSELGNATADFAINDLMKNHGIRKFAIMVEDDIWTKYIRDIWVQRIKETPGAEVVFDGTFSSQTKDFGVLFQKIIDAGAQYILDACSRVDASTYLKRWASMNAPPIGGVETGSGTELYYNLIGDKGLYVCSVATLPSPENPLTERAADWWKSYHGRFGDPAYTSGYSYDAVYILAEALRRAGKTDADALVAALEQTDYRGAVARWVFGKDHHPLYGEGYRVIPMMQYMEPGPRGFKVIWPPERATAKFTLPKRN